MQTNFTEDQLRDPSMAQANKILRSCVHCGFCTATCPTYQVLGDELDSPRGRIYLIKDMLENERVPDATTVKHLDRCLSCLACVTTCPSGVDYMHLIDQARAYVETHYKRPWHDRLLRAVLAAVLPYPGRFRAALVGAKLARPFRRFLPDPRLRAMLEMAPARIPPRSPRDDPQSFVPDRPRMRVALMTGCAQKALNTDINDATIRLLTRLGVEVVVAQGAGCCGALTHHMGKDSHGFAAANIRAWTQESGAGGLDGVVINTSGCGTTVKDYGHMFAGTDLAQEAAQISAMTMDISELLMKLAPDAALPVCPDHPARGMRVAYHPACSLQHGQRVTEAPKRLLAAAGFEVAIPADAHLCCGSAGTYNLLQPDISGRLKTRKVATLEALAPQVIAAGNIGCMMQIGSGTGVPVVHTVELLDWMTGGPVPAALTSDPLPQPVPVLRP
ncbi:glycolate oxidase subunit GlcF [Pseudooceanicola algae]|uniref:Glycolate oxidase iron-sulfur subunit n=1 Tax=Pseudooceanicola algae TaxID=1537215 RepID=A0A418SGA2_9RHOB|nr:glycolate oxidase subunit GlcF [Pseudooceanicola algae]QPM91713.1 Lactate utilization protein A [Pseudooceanicola algae]